MGALPMLVSKWKALYAGISVSSRFNGAKAQNMRTLENSLIDPSNLRYYVRNRWVEGGLLNIVLEEQGIGAIASFAIGLKGVFDKNI